MYVNTASYSSYLLCSVIAHWWL